MISNMVRDLFATVVAIVFSLIYMQGDARNAVVADSLSRLPLPAASVFARDGDLIGLSDVSGRLPSVAEKCYPITVSYLGFDDMVLESEVSDTVFLRESKAQLSEIVVESRRHKVLHMLAYVREYSTMTTYTDTVFLFREKMVDYMLTPDGSVKFAGWSTPRVLTGRSYYRFTDDCGLDSVSDTGSYHFSWSDWVGVAPAVRLPLSLTAVEWGADTLQGRYSPVEIWSKRGDSLSVEINVLADRTGRRWIPSFASFFREDLEFQDFRLRFCYNIVEGCDSVSPLELSGYYYNVESDGRGRYMFGFNRIDEPFFVNTEAEVYILDKEFITVKEARKWRDYRFDTADIGIYRPVGLPELQPSIIALIDRVNNIDKGYVRLGQAPDERLMGRFDGRRNFRVGRRALFMLKQLTGIMRYKHHKNINRRWNDLKKSLLLDKHKPTDR